MIKHITVFCALLLLLSGFAIARDRDFGAGIILGSPTGVSGKLWLGGRRTALDAALSVVSDGLYLHVDYLWHDYTALPKPEKGRLPLYYGIGGRISGSDLGARGVIGIEYIFAGYPFDLFFELAPVISLVPDVGFHLTGGLGGRYFFGGR